MPYADPDIAKAKRRAYYRANREKAIAATMTWRNAGSAACSATDATGPSG